MRFFYDWIYMSQKIISDKTCEILSTLTHFIPANEPQLLADTQALCHDMRTALALPDAQPVGIFYVSHFRNSPAMRNTEFQELGDLPPGAYDLYATPQPVIDPEPVKLTDAQPVAMQDIDKAILSGIVKLNHHITEDKIIFRKQTGSDGNTLNELVGAIGSAVIATVAGRASPQPAIAAEPVLQGIADQLRKAGATLPIAVNGTIESAMQAGLSIALVMVEDAIAKQATP